ncbi:MAG TPA: ABC transporter substrate-binding protein [Candidatus Acidoferrales bacterium]|nr:ABC transporter substrate-binding protein [Candidatus Acidoferrales bacterium]
MLQTLGVSIAAPVLFMDGAMAQELRPVRVGLSEGDDATPTLYAIKTGLFKKYGLDAQLVPAPSGAASLAALAGGAIDIAGTSILPFLSARSRGLPLEIVAPLAVYSPESVYAAIIVKKDAPYRTGRDLNGKTIASPALRDLNWVASMAWIDRNGGDSTTVKSVEIPSSAIPVALDEGRIDAATVTTPRYVQAVKTGKARVLGKAYEAIAQHFVFAAFVAQSDYATKNPDVIARFGRAIRDATVYTNAHHAQTLELYAAFAKIDPKDIVDAPRAVSSQYVVAKDLQPMIDVAVRYKVIAQPMDPQTLLSPAILKPST